MDNNNVKNPSAEQRPEEAAKYYGDLYFMVDKNDRILDVTQSNGGNDGFCGFVLDHLCGLVDEEELPDVTFRHFRVTDESVKERLASGLGSSVPEYLGDPQHTMPMVEAVYRVLNDIHLLSHEKLDERPDYKAECDAIRLDVPDLSVKLSGIYDRLIHKGGSKFLYATITEPSGRLEKIRPDGNRIEDYLRYMFEQAAEIEPGTPMPEKSFVWVKYYDDSTVADGQGNVRRLDEILEAPDSEEKSSLVKAFAKRFGDYPMSPIPLVNIFCSMRLGKLCLPSNINESERYYFERLCDDYRKSVPNFKARFAAYLESMPKKKEKEPMQHGVIVINFSEKKGLGV